MNESDNNFSIEGTPGESDKSMQLVLASDYAVVREKYIEVIEHTKNMDIHARWIYGKHPTDVMIQSYIDRNAAINIREEALRLLFA